MAEILTFPQPVVNSVSDADERERALDITQSWIVEAPAGSGKTGLLIQRFLKLLAAEGVDDPAQVLAITFTRKATAEMRDRVYRQLQQAAAGTECPNPFDQQTRTLALHVIERDRQLGWDLLGDPRRLNIRTIDSVCADIARGLPVLSGSGGGLAPTENASALHAAAAHRTLMLLGGPDTRLNAALEELLLHRDGNLANCESLIATMLGWRDQWGELVPLSMHELDEHFLDTVVLPKLDHALDHAVCRALTRLAQILPIPLLERLSRLAEEMAHAEGYKGAPSPIAVCQGRNRPPAEKSEDIDHWRAIIHLLVKPSEPRDWRKALHGHIVGFEILKHHQADLKDIIEQLAAIPGLVDDLCRIDALPPAQYPRDQWPIAKSLFRVLSRALVELQFVFAAEGQSDFTEAALQAKAALRREGALDDLRTSAGTSLQHLLVDEMQDTSSSQYELVQLLTQHWDGRSQTVFLVGDPKQSIYLFRQARVERFVHTMRTGLLGDLPLGTLHLSANFRSQRNLVEGFNETFSLLFPSAPDATRPELVPYRAAHASRKSAPTPGIVWHANALPYSAETAVCTAMRRNQTREDAAEIRRLVEQWRGQPFRADHQEPPRLAVLVRNRTHLLEIVAAFKAEPAIPFRAVNTEALGERQEILDLLALTRALLHPGDRTAWLALLRTPWCGLTLADLHLLAGADDDALASATVLELLDTRGDLLSDDGIARLTPFWSVMAAAVSQRTQMPLARLVERTWHAFDGPAHSTDEQLTNIHRFFCLLDDLEGPQGFVDVPMLADRLAGLYAAPATTPGAVDLLTIHGAKGLEWDVVFVPALDRVGVGNTGKLVDWLETDAGSDVSDDDIAHGILAPIKSKGGASKELNDWMRSIEAGREAAERSRLFYVACTRAREEVHLFASPSRNKAGELKPHPNSLLAAAWPAAGEHFMTDAPLLEPPQPVLALAAAAEPPLIKRIVSTRLAGDAIALTLSAPTRFPRPEGSFAARSFGNAMHAFLEQLTRRIASGAEPDSLLDELPSWSPRIAAVLRASGLPAELVIRFSANIVRGLSNTLRSEEGRWLLAQHPGASTESAFSASLPGESRASIRLDRTFLAGSAPGLSGDTHLWIVDYKTGTHGPEGLETFLQAEEVKYRPQLEAYAAQLGEGGHPIRLALFYPLLPALRVLD